MLRTGEGKKVTGRPERWGIRKAPGVQRSEGKKSKTRHWGKGGDVFTKNRSTDSRVTEKKRLKGEKKIPGTKSIENPGETQ